MSASSGIPTGTGFVNIASAGDAFAALKADGSIAAWGSSASGGSGAPLGTGFVSVASTVYAFAALKADGSITAWGGSNYGGSGAPTAAGFVSINGVSPQTPKNCRFILKLSMPVITSNNGNPLAVGMYENSTAVTDINASDAEDGDETRLRYSLGNTDAALFQIGTDGKLAFKAIPDFENPKQQGATPNVYSLTVTVTDSSGLTASQAITVTVNDVYEASPPIFTSSNNVTFVENSSSAVINANATDDKDSEGNGLTYQLDSSALTDNALFNFDSATGMLTFKSPPVYASPKDANKDNTYIVALKVCDSDNACTTQTLLVVVTNIPSLVLEYSIRRDGDSSRYRVYMRPQVTPTKNINVTGQITLKVPHGTGGSKFGITDLQSAIGGVTWTQNLRSDAPSEGSNADYISFTFSPKATVRLTGKQGKSWKSSTLLAPPASAAVWSV